MKIREEPAWHPQSRMAFILTFLTVGQRLCGHGRAPAQVRIESWNISPAHRLVVRLALADLWQNACIFDARHGVFAGSEAFGFGHVQNNLEALGQTPRGFMLRRPDWRQAHQDFGLANRIDRHAPDLGKGIVTQRVDPLLPVLGILPSWQAFDVNLLGNFLKCWGFLTRVVSRVQTLPGHPTVF